MENELAEGFPCQFVIKSERFGSILQGCCLLL
jgi:hypothetical protein